MAESTADESTQTRRQHRYGVSVLALGRMNPKKFLIESNKTLMVYKTAQGNLNPKTHTNDAKSQPPGSTYFQNENMNPYWITVTFMAYLTRIGYLTFISTTHYDFSFQPV